MDFTKSQLNTKRILDDGRNVLLTGKPGTGKTELLRNFCDERVAQGYKVLTTGSTGMAASNFDGGRTIHSVLHWSPGREKYDIERCAEDLRSSDVLIIDEISMLGPDILNHLAACLNCVDRRPQLVMVGDFSQLPPAGSRVYPFENPNWQLFDLTSCVLKEVVRQKDPVFISMLERLMHEDPSCIPYFNLESCRKIIDGAICICTRNDYADQINDRLYSIIPELEKEYKALGEVDQCKIEKFRVKRSLLVKKGMRVMSIRNDILGRYQNGSLGTVVNMDGNSIRVQFDNGNCVDVGRTEYWIDHKDINKEAVKIEQFPLIGGYAITIHKSQGQTFDSVNIKAPDCWDPGQLYVALSRVRSIKGMYLMDPITRNSLRSDPRVVKYNEWLRKTDAAA